jgi:hypothetical protein
MKKLLWVLLIAGAGYAVWRRCCCCGSAYDCDCGCGDEEEHAA